MSNELLTPRDNIKLHTDFVHSRFSAFENWNHLLETYPNSVTQKSSPTDNDHIHVRLFLRESIVSEWIHLVIAPTLSEYGVVRTPGYWRDLLSKMMDVENNRLVGMMMFQTHMRQPLEVLGRAVSGKLVIADFPKFCREVTEIFEECKSCTGGKNANYIPELSKANPNSWGVAIETVDGQQFTIGDAATDFSIQSCAKPFTYCMACESVGSKEVHKWVGTEPSGASFNAFTLNSDKVPFNPLINTGAIVAVSLVKPKSNPAVKFRFLQNFFSQLAGDQKVGFSNSIYLSEKSTCLRNRALVYFMAEQGCFPEGTDLEETLEMYLMTCSLEVNCKILASMSATLANVGINPTSGKTLLKHSTCMDTLILLFSCGMYDYSGGWAFNVGLPAKSGVSGCIYVVVPNVLGMAIWSPPLDEKGNSLRGIEFCKKFAQRFDFHMFSQLLGLNHNHPTKEQIVNPLRQLGAIHGTDLNKSLPSVLCHIAQNGDLLEMERLVSRIPTNLVAVTLSEGDYDYRTPLHIAASDGQLKIVKFLVSRGANVNAVDRWGSTPLNCALDGQWPDVAQWLQSNTDAEASPSSHSWKPTDSVNMLTRLEASGIEIPLSKFNNNMTSDDNNTTTNNNNDNNTVNNNTTTNNNNNNNNNTTNNNNNTMNNKTPTDKNNINNSNNPNENINTGNHDMTVVDNSLSSPKQGRTDAPNNQRNQSLTKERGEQSTTLQPTSGKTQSLEANPPTSQQWGTDRARRPAEGPALPTLSSENTKGDQSSSQTLLSPNSELDSSVSGSPQPNHRN